MSPPTARLAEIRCDLCDNLANWCLIDCYGEHLSLLCVRCGPIELRREHAREELEDARFYAAHGVLPE